MTTTRDRVLAAIQAFRPRPVDVPELGGTIYLRPLTVAGFARMHRTRALAEEAVAAAKKALESAPDDQSRKDALESAEDRLRANEDEISVRVMADAIVDENGRQIFDTLAGERILAGLPATIAGNIMNLITDAVQQTAGGDKGAAGN